MQTISRAHTVSTFDDDRDPVAVVQPGEQVRVEVGMGSRAPTGPIAIAGAEPGDVASVRILDVVTGERGMMWARPGAGLLAEQLFEHLSETHYHEIGIELGEGVAHFAEGIDVALSLNVGVVGVAPGPRGPESDTRYPGRHGGNLDCNLVRAGSTVLLPVSRPQARLCVGDVHARMGDGESITCGLETTGSVDLEVDLIRRRPLSGPLIRDGAGIGFVASAPTFDLAARAAFARAAEAIGSHHGLGFVEAGLLAGLIVDVRVAQLVNPRVTAVAYVASSDAELDLEQDCLRDA